MGVLAISLNCVISKGNYTNSQLLDSSAGGAFCRKQCLVHTDTHMHIFPTPQPHAFAIRCKLNVNVFQALRYISAISGTVLSTTMVCREQWSRDQCSVSGYQRETSFVNSSPTVSRLHSWLTARCVPLPCLHAAPKHSCYPCIPSVASLSPSALITADCGCYSHQRCTQT